MKQFESNEGEVFTLPEFIKQAKKFNDTQVINDVKQLKIGETYIVDMNMDSVTRIS